jgi:hypothetical protein
MLLKRGRRRTHQRKIPLTLEPDFLLNDWYGYRGQVTGHPRECIRNLAGHY